MAIQFNYFLDKGAFVANPDGTFHVDFSKIKDAVTGLDHEFLTLEATGDYAGTKKMMDQLMNIRPVVMKAIESLKTLPTDIEPKFVTADELTWQEDAGSRAKIKFKKVSSKAFEFVDFFVNRFYSVFTRERRAIL